MSILTIILFFMYIWGFGFTATSFLKNSDNFFERNIMRLGIGLGAFFLIGTILNLFHIPLDWKVFLILSMIYPVYFVVKKSNKIKESFFNIKITKSEVYLGITILLFIFTFYMYHNGAFAYPYLENDDPWEHARSVTYIATEKTAYEPSYAQTDLFRYIDPYPPGYETLMAVLYQTNDSINWTLKFFNALIISLSIIMFYFFAGKFTQSKKKALFATFVLAMIPCYLSHFIWVHSLLPFLLFIAFYCLESLNDDRKWLIPSSAVIGGIFVVHPEHAIKFMMLFSIYFVIKWVFEKKAPLYSLYSLLIGGIFSLSWWATKFVSMFQERAGRIAHLDAGLVSQDTGIFYKLFSFMKNYFSPYSGSATRPYTFNDFFVSKDANMINNPIGIGIIISILTIISIILIVMLFKRYYTEKRAYPIITVGWFILTFLIVNSATFNIPGFFGFRTWLLMAVPISILCAEGYFILVGSIPKNLKIARWILLFIVIIGMWYTSGSQKYAVNTAMWPPGASWTSMEEVQLYLWLNNLPKHTKVMPFSGNQNNEVIGLDMDNCDWCKENIEFRKDFLNKTSEQTYTFLKDQGYQYFILDSMSIKTYEAELGNNTQSIILGKFEEYFNETNKFGVVFQNKAGIILKIL